MKKYPLILFLCAAAGAPPAARAGTDLSGGRILDLTHSFYEGMPCWPTSRGFKLYDPPPGSRLEKDEVVHYFSSPEHCGTHIDAPIHFHPNRETVDMIPLERLVGRGIVVDVSSQCRADPDYRVRVEDFLRYEKKNGRIADGSIVLLRTGFEDYWPDRRRYLGTDDASEKGLRLMHFPGLAADAAKWLATERSIKAVGLDTEGIDPGQSVDFGAHRTLFERSIPAFENLAGLDLLPDKGFTVVALPIKIRGGSGGPLRIIAILDDPR